MEKAESFSDNIVSNTPNGIMVLDEMLNIQLMNRAMCRIVGIEEASSILHKNVTAIFDPDDFINAMDGKFINRKKTYLSEYDKYVENTIIFDHKFRILLCIMKDITRDEIQEQKHAEIVKKSIEITDKVIEKNMRAVQEIASLLGESTAETKVALSSLKDTLEDDK
jgi:PAS domain S-box-containing protein